MILSHGRRVTENVVLPLSRSVWSINTIIAGVNLICRHQRTVIVIDLQRRVATDSRSAAVMDLLVPLEVALVARSVVAQRTRVVFLTAVNRKMPLEQRLAAEVAGAVATRVAGAVKYRHVIAQGRLAAELNGTTFERLSAGRSGFLVHRCHVTFEIVLPVRQIATLRTAEDPFGTDRPAGEHGNRRQRLRRNEPTASGRLGEKRPRGRGMKVCLPGRAGGSVVAAGRARHRDLRAAQAARWNRWR